MISSIRREHRKITRNLGGIRKMKRKPDAIVIIDPRREHIAAKEAKKLGIPTVCLLDTDCDPEYADIPIPGNDDAFRSIQIVLSRLSDAILRGRQRWKSVLEEQKRQEEQRREEEARRQEALRKAREQASAAARAKKAEGEAAAAAAAAVGAEGAKAPAAAAAAGEGGAPAAASTGEAGSSGEKA
jgi:small subunit ribosomal protein S2